MADEQQTQPAVEAKATEQTQAATSAATQNTEPQSQEHMIPKSRFDEVNEKLRLLQEEAGKKAKADAEAEEQRLAKQAEWQTLADQRKAKVEELTPKAQLADELSAIINEMNDAEIADWPESIKSMDPGKEVDVRIRRAWINKARVPAQELLADKTVVAGNGRRPTPTGGSSRANDQQREDLRKQVARSYLSKF